VLFPLGELPGKVETRRLAREAGLPVADKPDSQEICFVSDAGGYREFLRRERPGMFGEGELVTPAGDVIGRHRGVADFTIGQRRGLGISSSKPLYVIGLEPKTNRVVVGEEGDLRLTKVHLSDVVWSGKSPDDAPLRVMAKIRYNMEARPATLYAGSEPWLEFDEPVRAVTPGQVAVAYQGKTVTAGGTILRGS
jgi:tRNA-uridine 2-sulfurtransferase